LLPWLPRGAGCILQPGAPLPSGVRGDLNQHPGFKLLRARAGPAADPGSPQWLPAHNVLTSIWNPNGRGELPHAAFNLSDLSNLWHDLQQRLEVVALDTKPGGCQVMQIVRCDPL
jgi:hypothetical protein